MTDNLDRLKAALADGYTIEAQLGQGGMATVYLAHDVKHDRKVAVKVFRPDRRPRPVGVSMGPPGEVGRAGYEVGVNKASTCGLVYRASS